MCDAVLCKTCDSDLHTVWQFRKMFIETEKKLKSYQKQLNLPRKLQNDDLLQIGSMNGYQSIGGLKAIVKEEISIKCDELQKQNSELMEVEPNVNPEEEENGFICQRDKGWGTVIEGDTAKDEKELKYIEEIVMVVKEEFVEDENGIVESDPFKDLVARREEKQDWNNTVPLQKSGYHNNLFLTTFKKK